MTAYVIADIKVTDGGWVPAYAASVHDIVHRHGGKYLARSGNVKTHGRQAARHHAYRRYGLSIGAGSRSVRSPTPTTRPTSQPVRPAATAASS